MAVPPGPTVLKQLDRAAKVAWCPSAHYANLFATGTVAGTIDDSFETRSQLEIYDINLSSPSLDLAFFGSITTKDSFHSVAWGSKGIAEDVSTNVNGSNLSHGIIAGGMSDGAVNIWSVNAILNSANHSPSFSTPSSSSALLSRSENHKGQVLSLAFHPSQPNLLASGATDGEVLVWDLAQPHKPVASKPNPMLRGQNPTVTAVAWNRKAASILASTTEHGETTVWDLRQKKSVISFRNSARSQLRATALAWNPEGQVTLAVVYANHPVCEVWDLRQSMTPKLKLEGQHTSSILGMDWCPHDGKLLVTTGEDGRICLWDPTLGTYLSDMPSTGSAQFDVSWSPHHKNVISMCSYDGYGKVSLQAVAQTGTHVPSWVQKPCPASFGFGGKLVTLGLDNPLQASPGSSVSLPQAAKPAGQPPVTALSVSTLMTDPKLIELSHNFQQVLSSGDFVTFCQQAILAAESKGNEEERITWLFMKILFEEERNQRFSLLKELGFDPPQGSELLNNGNDVQDNFADQASQDALHPQQPIPPPEPEISEDSFFDQDFSANNPQQNGVNLSETKEEIPSLHSNSSAASEKSHKETEPHPEKEKKMPRRSLTADDDVYTSFSLSDEDEKEIRHALIYGDFNTAVARCLATGRLADAIIFSSFGPPQLWQDTRNYYFTHHKHPFIRTVMKNVSAENLEEMVSTAPLVNPNATSASASSFNAPSASSWKEVLAILVTYTTAERYRALVTQLASRLEEAGMMLPALICYLCSSQVEKSVELLSKQSSAAPIDPALALHHSIEKVAVFAAAIQAHLQPTSPLLALKYSEYATSLASQGYFIGAWNYLRLASPTSTDSSTAILLDRLYHASYTTVDQVINQPPPPFPFAVEHIGVDPMMRQLEQQVEAWKRAKEARIQASVHHQSQAQQQQIKQQQDMMAVQQTQQTQQTHMAAPNQQQQQQQQQPVQHQRPGSYSQPQPQLQTQAQIPHPAGPYYQPSPAQQNPYQPQPPQPAHLPPVQQQQQQPARPGFPQSHLQNPPQQQPAPHLAPGGARPSPQPQFQQPQPYQQNNRPGFPQPQPQHQPQHQPQPSYQPSSQPPPQSTHAGHPPAQTGAGYGGPPAHSQGSYQQSHMPPPQQQHQPPQHQYSSPPPPTSMPPSSYSQPTNPPPPTNPLTSYQSPPPVSNMPAPPSQGHQQRPSGSSYDSYGQSQQFQPQQQQQQQQQQQHQQHSPHAPNPLQPPAGPSHPMQPQKLYNPASQPPSQQSTPAPSLPQSHIQSAPSTNAAGSAPSSAGILPLTSLQFPPEFQPIVSALEQTITQLHSSSLMPPEQRKLTNITQHILILYNRLAIPNSSNLTPSLISELTSLVNAMSVGDITLADRHRMNIVKVDWNGNNEWLMALKNLLLMKKKYIGGR